MTSLEMTKLLKFLVSLDTNFIFFHHGKTFARFILQRDHGIMTVVSRRPGDTEVKQSASQMTLNHTHRMRQDTNAPLHLPSGWWIAPMIGLGIAMWYWIISGFLSLLS